ncbi:hypothetical protein DSUL_60079 [Desulfovibrionales bacterium]
MTQKLYATYRPSPAECARNLENDQRDALKEYKLHMILKLLSRICLK